MPNTLEQLTVKAAGTVKAVKAGFNGLRGVFLHLAEEHGEVVAMMKHVSKSKDAQVRRGHYAKIRVELLSHELAELAELYPHLAHLESTRELVAQHDRQATQLESAIREPFGIDALDPSSDAWGMAFDRLLVLVEQHIAQEEGELFPKAQAAIGDAAAEALRTRYEAAKISAKKQLA
jgi:Hemerythrin HHE cation binding domain